MNRFLMMKIQEFSRQGGGRRPKYFESDTYIKQWRGGRVAKRETYDGG